MSMLRPMHASDLAFIVHRTPTRIRIKIPDRRGQKSYFEALKPALLAHPDVLEVEATPLTGSVISNCRAGFTLATQDQQFPRLTIAPAAFLAPVGLEQSKCVPEAPVGTATVAIIAKALDLFLAIATNQLGSRLLEWALQTLAEAARGQVYRPELRQREPLLLGIATLGRGGWPPPERFCSV
jgi:hypothetical protein